MKVIRKSRGHKDHARGPSQSNPGAGWAVKVKIEDDILRSLLRYVLRAKEVKFKTSAELKEPTGSIPVLDSWETENSMAIALL